VGMAHSVKPLLAIPSLEPLDATEGDGGRLGLRPTQFCCRQGTVVGMQGQRSGTVAVPQGPRWKAIRCGLCARKNPGRTATALAQVSRLPTVIDLRRAPPHLTVPGFEVDRSGALRILPRRKDVMPYADIRLLRGALRKVQRDAPRMSAARIRSFIAKERPDLTPERIDDLVRERISNVRTRESERRVSFDEVKVLDGHVTLECRKCGATPRLSVRKLSTLAKEADRSGKDLYVSARGQTVVR
jgi:hypothetical protein